jgi:hypothetical protein
MYGGFVSSTLRIRWRGWWEVFSVSSTEQKQICWKLGAWSLPFYYRLYMRRSVPVLVR